MDYTFTPCPCFYNFLTLCLRFISSGFHEHNYYLSFQFIFVIQAMSWDSGTSASLLGMPRCLNYETLFYLENQGSLMGHVPGT